MVRGNQRLLVLVAILVMLHVPFLGALYVGFQVVHPSSHTEIAVTNISPGTHYLSIAVESHGTLRSLEWSFPGPFGSSSYDPAHCISSYHSPRGPKDVPKLDWEPHVVWEEGERYAVITRTLDRKWHATWFDASALSFKGRIPGFAGGQVTFDLAKGTNCPLDDALVVHLGLKHVEGVNTEAMLRDTP